LKGAVIDEDFAAEGSGESPPSADLIGEPAELDQRDDRLGTDWWDDEELSAKLPHPDDPAEDSDDDVEFGNLLEVTEPLPDVELVEALPADAFDLEVRTIKPVEPVKAGEAEEQSSRARSAGEAAASLGLRAIEQTLTAGWSLVRGVAESPPGRVISEMAAGAMDALAEDPEIDWPLAGRLGQEQLERVISVVVPVVVQSLDPAELMEYIDVNEIMDAVDVNAVLDRVDVNAVLDRVDVNAILDRVDVNALLAQADIDLLMERVDLNEVLAGVDVNAIVDRLDMDALLERVDVATVAKRAKIGELVAESTGDVAGSVLDLGRRQAVALDTIFARTFNRILGRDPDAMPQGPSLLVDESPETEG
jgi:hypothetical protein